jgi:hypothetical protein
MYVCMHATLGCARTHPHPHAGPPPPPTQVQLLVSSDGMARGMDLPNVAAVVNYDVPTQVKTYVHRCVRACVRAWVSGLGMIPWVGGITTHRRS